MERYNLYLVFLSLIILSCTANDETLINGDLGRGINDTLIVVDINQSQELRETIIITDGKFNYSIKTAFPDFRIASNKDQSIVFNFLTYPGHYTVNKENGQININGALNEKLNSYYFETVQKKIAQDRLKLKMYNGEDVTEELSTINNDIKSYLIQTASSNKSTPLAGMSIFAASQMLPDDAELFNTLYSFTDVDQNKNTSLGSFVESLMPRYQKPNNLPEAQLRDKNDLLYNIEPVSKYMYIDFWASWCKPCRQKIPDLKLIHSKFQDSLDIEFLSVSIDEDAGSWMNALSLEDMPWRQMIVEDKSSYNLISNHWGVISIPHGVLIDNNGKTIENYIRNKEQLEEVLSKL